MRAVGAVGAVVVELVLSASGKEGEDNDEKGEEAAVGEGARRSSIEMAQLLRECTSGGRAPKTPPSGPPRPPELPPSKDESREEDEAAASRAAWDSKEGPLARVS